MAFCSGGRCRTSRATPQPLTSTVAVNAVAETRTIRDVELVRVGSHDISTGTWSVTRDDLAAAVAAHAAGIVSRPVVKLGHDDDRFDGTPAFGYIADIRLARGGDSIVGDLEVPAWLADALPIHYPRRSVEAVTGLKAADGTTHRLVLTAVSLLGATAPGIANLAELQELVAASTGRVVLTTTDSPARTDHLTTIAAARRRRSNRK